METLHTPEALVCRQPAAVANLGRSITPMTTQSIVSSLATEEFEPLLNSREAAALLRMHYKTLERKARSGEIPSYQVVGRWFFRASELDSWLRSQVNLSGQSVRMN